MRIISKFHDYYDCIQAIGQDRSLIYLRQPRTVSKEVPDYFDKLKRAWWWSSKLIKEASVIGFCGRLYPVLKLWEPNEGTVAYCYTLTEVDQFVHTHFRRDLAFRYMQPRDHKKFWLNTWDGPRHVNFAAFFRHAETVKDQHRDLFETPVFIYRREPKPTITYDDCLRDYQFYRIIDPYTAFQELSMWLGGLASPEKPIPTIDDKTMAGAKGFDKWSFRKEKKK